MQIESMIQSKGLGPKFLFEGLEPLFRIRRGPPPLSIGIVSPTIVPGDFAGAPSLWIDCRHRLGLVGVAQLEDEAHSSVGVGDLADFSAVEEGEVVGVGGTGVVGDVGHAGHGGRVDFGLLLFLLLLVLMVVIAVIVGLWWSVCGYGLKVRLEFVREDQLEHHPFG